MSCKRIGFLVCLLAVLVVPATVGALLLAPYLRTLGKLMGELGFTAENRRKDSR